MLIKFKNNRKALKDLRIWVWHGKAQFVINSGSRGHFGDKVGLSKAVSLQYYHLRSLAGLLLRWWWVEMEVQSLSIDSDVELWQWEHFIQEYLTLIEN